MPFYLLLNMYYNPSEPCDPLQPNFIAFASKAHSSCLNEAAVVVFLSATSFVSNSSPD